MSKFLVSVTEKIGNYSAHASRTFFSKLAEVDLTPDDRIATNHFDISVCTYS